MGIFKNNKKKETKEEILKQDITQKADPSHLFMIWLLFDKEPIKPAVLTIKEALESKFGEVDMVAPDGALNSFAVKKYVCHFKDADIPPQVMISEVQPFKEDLVSDFERTQLWNVENAAELLDSCSHQLMISDMMSFMEYKDRCDLLMDWMEAAVELFPECSAVWIPTAGKLFTAEQVREHQIPRDDRFVYFCVNVRFFTIQDSDDMIVDTLGMYAMGLPDIQYHFHTLEPNAVVNHAYNSASYLYINDAAIENGETIDGLENGVMTQDVQWRCQYEDSLIQPVRVVMDICAGEFSSGNRA